MLMRKLQIIFLTLVLVLGFQAAAQAIIVNDDSQAGVKIGDTYIPLSLTKGEKGYYFPEQTFQTAEGSFTLSVNTDIDPFILMAIGAVNFTPGPLAFVFGVAVPIAMPALPTTINASLVGGITDGDGVGGVTITPLLNPTILWNTALGAAWGAGPAGAGGPGPAGFPYVYGPAVFGPAAGPFGGAGLFTESISFTLSGGDSTGLTGFCSINPVPVPPTLVLMGSALLGLVGWRRFRKN
jgi:hypothetical protein